jgi:hypothetical protein
MIGDKSSEDSFYKLGWNNKRRSKACQREEAGGLFCGEMQGVRERKLEEEPVGNGESI